jgi:hypothetical protein
VRAIAQASGQGSRRAVKLTLPTVRKTPSGGEGWPVRLRVSAAARAKLKAYRKVTVKVTVTATDAVGTRATGTLTIKLGR